MSGTQRITHTGILPCSIISDDDGIYACVYVRVSRYQPRYNYIRIINIFNERSFLEDFPPFLCLSQITLMILMTSYRPLIISSENTWKDTLRLKKVRITRPPVPWIKCRLIQDLQHQRDTPTKHITQTQMSVGITFELLGTAENGKKNCP